MPYSGLEDSREGEPPTARGGDPIRGDGLSILWVDDEPYALANYKALLSARGFDVRTARTLHEGFTVLASCPQAPDLIILDIMMNPGAGAGSGLGPDELLRSRGGFESGVVFADRVRKSHPAVPVVVYSAYSDSFARQWFKARGIPFVSKTTSFRDIDDVLSVLVLPFVSGSRVGRTL